MYDVVGDIELVSAMHHECLIAWKTSYSGESEIDFLEQEPMCGTCNYIAGSVFEPVVGAVCTKQPVFGCEQI